MVMTRGFIQLAIEVEESGLAGVGIDFRFGELARGTLWLGGL